MKKNQFVSLEIALKLKDKGYPDLTSYAFYNNESGELFLNLSVIPSENFTGAPLYQEATEWLREVRGIHITIRRMYFGLHGEFEYNDFLYMPGSNKNDECTIGNEFPTYQEALENAIKTALNFLP